MSETINKYLGEEGLRKLIDLTKAYDAASLTLSQEYINEEIAKIKSGDVVVKEANHATTADSAANATHAVSADTATEANHAITADSATNATNAQHAVSADSATEASHAVTADSATKAIKDGSDNVITETYETKVDASTKLDTAKQYADTQIAALVNSAPETLDTLGELATAINENQSVIDALDAAITNKADKEHTHIWNDIEDRPFGETEIENYTSLFSENFSNGGSFPTSMLYYSGTHRITIDRTDVYVIEKNTTHFGDSSFSTLPFRTEMSSGMARIYFQDGRSHRVEVELLQGTEVEIKTLDEKYIPDTIARVEDIQSEFIYVELDDSMQSFMTFYSKISQYKNGERPLILEYTDSDGKVYTSMPTFFGSNGDIDFMIPMSRGSYVIHFESDGTGTSIKPTFENDKLKLSNWESSRTGATDFYPSINAMEEYVESNTFSGSWNDLENKPFGEIKELVEQTSYNPREVGAGYTVIYDGVEYDVTISQANYRDPNAARPTLEYGSYYYVGNPQLLNDGYEVSVQPDNRYPFCIYTTDRYGANRFLFVKHSDNSVSHTYALYTKTVATKQIDEIYLPDTVASKTYVDDAIANIDIPEQVNADWSVNDETSPAYIKNKPTEEDALMLLIEMGMIEPAVDADGTILTDENGYVFSY